MKPHLFLSALLALGGPALAGDFIRQIQHPGGVQVIYDIPIAGDTGTVLSQPLVADSSVFQLYAIATKPDGTEGVELLDEKTVGTYVPDAKVEILSEDPYSPPRTRADKPYGVRVTLGGLQATQAAPATARTVELTRSYRLYDPATFLPTGTEQAYTDTFEFTADGTYTDNAILQRLPVEHPTKAAGEESFTARTVANGNSPASVLAKGTVQIWPVASASFDKIEEGKTYQSIPADAAYHARDLYPDSVTYVQLYEGTQQTGKVGSPLPNTVVSFKSSAPQSASLGLTDLDAMIGEDGTYTIELVTATPFNGGAPEILSHVTFEIDRTINVRGMIGTVD